MDMTIAHEPDSDRRRAPLGTAADDAAGRLLAAMLAAAGLTRPAPEPALAEAAG
jgi:hypothetical protein